MVERKSTLFSVVVTGVMAILALPIIIPHILHGYHIKARDVIDKLVEDYRPNLLEKPIS